MQLIEQDYLDSEMGDTLYESEIVILSPSKYCHSDFQSPLTLLPSRVSERDGADEMNSGLNVEEAKVNSTPTLVLPCMEAHGPHVLWD